MGFWQDERLLGAAESPDTSGQVSRPVYTRFTTLGDFTKSLLAHEASLDRLDKQPDPRTTGGVGANDGSFCEVPVSQAMPESIRADTCNRNHQV